MNHLRAHLPVALFPCNAILLLSAFCLLALFPAYPVAASLSDFRTPEYLSSTGLESINAAGAYALGFTGKGVILGVVDEPFAPAEGEFANKYPYGVFGEKGEGDHGIHVSGIMAALKDDRGVHGVAFDAKLLPWEGIGQSELAWALMLKHRDVRIVNNSWAVSYHLDGTYRADFWEDILEDSEEEIDLAKALAAQDKLIIMGAANDGHLTPSFIAGLPSVLDKMGRENTIGHNWLNIAAYNPRYDSSHPAFIWTSSNLGQDASEYTLLAPGVDINSTTSAWGYGLESGTSMATPYVSGVAALVQEAFPYMGGKQIADVLLSTATPLTGERQPRFIVLMREDYDEELELVDTKIVAYTPNSSITATADEKEALLEELNKYSPWDEEDTSYILNSALAFPVVMSDEAYAALFGQGMVNAFRAVQGPGYLNAGRLTDSALSSGEYGGTYAMYSVDSKGFDSIWSNNIGELRAGSGVLAGLPVGLLKEGAGLLYLTGANTYSGPTVVDGGGISLGREGSGSSASVSGDVLVGSGGLFTGDGKVGGSLSSAGLLMPGLEGDPGSRLSVQSGVTSTGLTRFVLGRNGLANGLDGKSIVLSGPLEVSGSKGAPLRPYQSYMNVAVATDSLRADQNAPIRVSPFLSFLPTVSGNTLSLVSRTSALNSLNGVAGRSQAVADALEHMFHRLDGRESQRGMDFLYNESRSGFLETAANMRGDLQASTLTGLPFGDGLLRRVLPGRAQGKSAGDKALADKDRDTRFWLRPVMGYGVSGADSRIGQERTSTHMRGLVAGFERDMDAFRGGFLLAIGDSDLEQDRNEADIRDARAGIYGGYYPGAFSLKGLLSVGWQRYETDRYVKTPEARQHLHSSFHGYTAGLGLEAAFDLLRGYDTDFAFSPYAAFDFDYIYQQSRKESGGLFALDVHAKHLTRTALRPGLRLDYAPLDGLALSATLGYKRLLSGHRPGVSAAFKADSDYRFTAVSKDEGKDFLEYGFRAEVALHRNVTLAAGLLGEKSDRSRQHHGFLNIRFEW